MKPKLRTYSLLKKQLLPEPFLTVYHRIGIPELVKIRGGTNRLRIEQGRYKKEAITQRICESCESKEIEDERHFMLKCPAYQTIREKMWKEFEKSTGRKRESFASETAQLNALIGDEFQPGENEKKDSVEWIIYREIVMTVMMFIIEAMNRRRGLQSSEKCQVR